MKQLLTKFNTTMLLFVSLIGAPLYAQMSDGIKISTLYDKVFTGFEHGQIKKDVITLFENNFSKLRGHIETTATRNEEQQLIEFLKTEFKQYVDVMALKESAPEEFESWISYKHKDYQSLILGKNIQAISRNKIGQEKIIEYKKELKSLLSELLEIRLAKEEEDIVGLENRLNQLKKIHQARMKNKEKILVHRMDELTGNKQVYQW